MAKPQRAERDFEEEARGIIAYESSSDCTGPSDFCPGHVWGESDEFDHLHQASDGVRAIAGCLREQAGKWEAQPRMHTRPGPFGQEWPCACDDPTHREA